MNVRPVPLAMDAQIRVSLGPALIPLRGLCTCVAAAPLSLLMLSLSALALSYRLGLAVSVLVIAFGLSVPDREGVWIATWWVYRLVHPLLSSAILGGRPVRARVVSVSGALRVTERRRMTVGPFKRLRLASLAPMPVVGVDAPGLMHLTPGGYRAVLSIDGPTCSITSDRYAQWCDRVVAWLLAVECPVQLLTVVDRFDAAKVQQAFDDRVVNWPRTPLAALERELAGRVAEQSTRFRHYVVFCPGMAGADGVPAASRIARVFRVREATLAEASGSLQTAGRIATGMDVRVQIPSREEMAELMAGTLLGASSAAVSRTGAMQIGDESAAVMTVARLPANVAPGALVEAVLRGRMQGIVSVHLFPVAASVARRLLDRRAAMHRYTAREGNDAVDNEVALDETSAVLASLAQRRLAPCRVAITVALSHAQREQLGSAVERVDGLLGSRGFGVVPVTSPGFIGALAASPGCAPLGRSLQLTSGDVASCLLPALGTPYSDHGQPLLGIGLATAAPVYISVWSRPNHNALVLGSSGAGKSVAAKTLLVRHAMEGSRVVVIDPDSEYRRVMNAIGGKYFELGDDALNVFAAASSSSADLAAGHVVPVLSVMAGDERGVRDGRVVRRLPDEDQGWLHTELVEFFSSWQSARHREPLMHDLVEFLEEVSIRRALTRRESERCRVISARLRRFTQGHKARVFDRQASFTLDHASTAVGLRALAMTYAADLTPALAMLLTAILATLTSQRCRTLIVVDEAHRITSDPDAGEVLGQLVRQARKHAAGVWMCSQKIDDFISTDLGRTLAATASTKLLLGAEESTIAGIRDVFALDDEECAALNPVKPGRAVLLSGSERAVVSILPGPAILSLADTTPRPLRSLPAAVAS